jgi:hypothetical protein
MTQSLASPATQGGVAPRPLPAPGPMRRRFGWLRRTVASLPPTFRAGFGLLGVGAIADVVYHLIHGLHSTHTHGTGFDVPTAIHLVVAAGMVVTLAGLVHAGVRSIRRSDHDKEAI